MSEAVMKFVDGILYGMGATLGFKLMMWIFSLV